MTRLFAVYSFENYEGLKEDIKFIEISEDDMSNPDNLGVDALTIMKAYAMGYNSVLEYAEENFEKGDSSFIEESISNSFDYCDEFESRMYKEYIKN